MKTLLTFLAFLFSYAVSAQVPQPGMQWLKMIEGNCTLSQCVSPQLDGGFILDVFATPGVDSFCTITTDRTVFLKYNSDASIFEWGKCYAGNSIDSAFFYMFSTLSDGYILGGISNGSTHEFLIHKENSSGIILWSKTYGNGAEAILESMIATNDGGYILFGESYYTCIDFPIHYGSSMNANFAVLKVDSNGNKIWSEVYGGTGIQLAASVITGPNGGCYITGSTSSNDFNCTGNHGGGDAYIARLDSNGNMIWHNDLGGSGLDGGEGTFAYPDGKGGAIITALSESSDGDVTHHINPGGANIWALEVDSNNNIVWNNCYGGAGQELPTCVCKAIDGSIWVAGYCEGKGGEVDTAYGAEDSWFVHADSAGNFLNAIVLGSNQQDQGMMVYPLSNGNVIAGGDYDINNYSFSSFPWNGGGAFLTVFEPWSTGIPALQQISSDLKIYPNPADEEVTIETSQQGNYNIEITDVVGKVIYKSGLNDKLQVSITGWQRGVYFVQVINENGYENVQKLIIQ